MNTTDREMYRESKAHMIHRCLRYRPGVEHRNYVFVRRGTSPSDYLRK
jgi:hypothetical protein